MADWNISQSGQMPGVQPVYSSYEMHNPSPEPAPAVRERGAFGKLTSLAGAAMSLALIGGVAVWGYQLMIRDVNGIPVVRAFEGPMRIQPEDPGGVAADHMGLAVNEVAALGTASDPADTLRLAPQPVSLHEEDSAGAYSGQAAAQVTQDDPTAASQEAVASFRDGSGVDALVEELTRNADPLAGMSQQAVLTPVAATPATPEVIEDAAAVAALQVAAPVPPVIDAPGLRVSLRPQVRPEGLRRASAPAPTATASTGVNDLDPAGLPAGTRLAQLGAYDSDKVARKEWTRLSGRFGSLLEGKSRVIQKATTGGRTFYRLRVAGFEDMSDARRFCSALVAENADCIPVTVR